MLKSRLKVILAEQNVTQQDLIQRMNQPVSKTTMSQIANGGSTRIEIALDIAQTLGVPVESIWSLEKV
jgi:DNA-binding XRE family transcriptional regulator